MHYLTYVVVSGRELAERIKGCPKYMRYSQTRTVLGELVESALAAYQGKWDYWEMGWGSHFRHDFATARTAMLNLREGHSPFAVVTPESYYERETFVWDGEPEGDVNRFHYNTIPPEEWRETVRSILANYPDCRVVAVDLHN